MPYAAATAALAEDKTASGDGSGVTLPKRLLKDPSGISPSLHLETRDATLRLAIFQAIRSTLHAESDGNGLISLFA
jgi:hypothetical protein